ncbi:autoinducer-2 kinase [candidate division KSB3 bacterium]|uniref:Autoinducer-2 kinase n=1 Tax=candidate division KSB3 bacterium TaxID=2044937 RepID=A0A2G6KFF4_9BACT|nr:MAG: autoinducer-2 kinase [candidate division KSB3 bacterium]
MRYVMALDAGTGSGRCVIFDERGKQVAVSQQEWTHISDPRFPGSMEFEVEKNWMILSECIRNALQSSGITAQDIVGISATSMREGIVLYDADGKELWACANVDSRATQEVIELTQKEEGLEEKIYKISGQTFSLGAIPRLLWVKKHFPDLYDAARTVNMLSDWVLYKLTGELVVDPSNGCTTGLFDLNTRQWKPEIAAWCGLRNDIFPPAYEAGTVIGKVHRAAAAQTGLQEGTVVIISGGDAQLGSVGVNAVLPGQTSVFGGSFWQQEVNMDAVRVDPECRIRVNCHSVPNLWQMEGIAFFPGLVARWFRDTFCQEELRMARATGIDAYTLLERQSAQVPAGAYGIVCTFSDVMNYIRWKHAAPSFINLDISSPEKSGKAALFRAIQENAAYVAYGNLKAIASNTGTFPNEVIFAGGASKGDLWCQIVTDVVGVPVKVPVVKEASALGSALCAAVGAGVFSSIEEAAQTTVAWEKSYEPDFGAHQVYQEHFERWQAVYAKQIELVHANVTSPMWSAPGV